MSPVSCEWEVHANSSLELPVIHQINTCWSSELARRVSLENPDPPLQVADFSMANLHALHREGEALHPIEFDQLVIRRNFLFLILNRLFDQQNAKTKLLQLQLIECLHESQVLNPVSDF